MSGRREDATDLAPLAVFLFLLCVGAALASCVVMIVTGGGQP